METAKDPLSLKGVPHWHLSPGHTYTMLVDEQMNVVVGQFTPYTVAAGEGTRKRTVTAHAQLATATRLILAAVQYGGAIVCRLNQHREPEYDIRWRSGTINWENLRARDLVELANTDWEPEMKQELKKLERKIKDGEVYWCSAYAACRRSAGGITGKSQKRPRIDLQFQLTGATIANATTTTAGAAAATIEVPQANKSRPRSETIVGSTSHAARVLNDGSAHDQHRGQPIVWSSANAATTLT